MAISATGLCTSCSLYQQHPSPFSSTLTGPSKHNSADVSSRKPSLTGPKLAQLSSRIPGFQALQGPTSVPPSAPRLSLWSSVLTLQQAFPTSIPVSVSTHTLPPDGLLPINHSRRGQNGGASGPREDVPTLPRERPVCWGISQGPLRPSSSPPPRRQTGGSEPRNSLNNPSNKNAN